MMNDGADVLAQLIKYAFALQVSRYSVYRLWLPKVVSDAGYRLS